MSNWDRARLSIVVPIGVIVAVAIVCIIVAVLSSAKRADEVAADHEEQLIARTLVAHGQRILREVESVAASNSAIQNIKLRSEGMWVQRRLGQWLTSFFEHDYVFIIAANDTSSYSNVKNFDSGSGWFATARTDIAPIVDYLYGNKLAIRAANHAPMLSAAGGPAPVHAVLVQSFTGRPAVVTGVAINLGDETDAKPLVIIAVKLIDNELLAAIASQAGLHNLRQIRTSTVSADNRVFELRGLSNEVISRLAWTPRTPGAEIVSSVLPYIAVALAGFALLAAFVLRYMRRTAVAIVTGEKRLRHLAMHDVLSGLPNRMYFSERLDTVIEGVKNDGNAAALLYIDLDHFKEVNDTLGHHVGDELIREVTGRITAESMDDDLVARLGGDEFAIITTRVPDLTAMFALAQRLITKICAPYSIENNTIVIGASIGIAVIDPNCSSAGDIMRYADMALYRAKNEGRNRACAYDMAMDADLAKRKILETELRLAVENDGLRLQYQPIVNNSGAVMLGVEALCRWTHPVRGEISPVEFIPVAEHSGLIITLGEWVLRRACLDGLAWPDLTVAVNVSPLQFRRADFVDTVTRILAETGFDPSRLELELTESTLIGNVESVDNAMRRLKALGIHLALDDFGTGYSSLQYLRRFPFDKLKIDRSFVCSIEKTPDAAAIVHAVVSLGRGLGMKVTAEGVETADQQLFLRAAGVHSMQGYRFGKPVDAADISDRVLAAAQAKQPKPALATAIAG